jgi:hypothetical protein
MLKEENLKLKDFVKREHIQMMVPLLTTIIEQGISEGSMESPNPERTAQMILNIGSSMNDDLFPEYLKCIEGEDNFNEIYDSIKFYEFSMEQLLKIEHGQLKLVNEPVLKGILLGKN